MPFPATGAYVPNIQADVERCACGVHPVNSAAAANQVYNSGAIYSFSNRAIDSHCLFPAMLL